MCRIVSYCHRHKYFHWKYGCQEIKNARSRLEDELQMLQAGGVDPLHLDDDDKVHDRMNNSSFVVCCSAYAYALQMIPNRRYVEEQLKYLLISTKFSILDREDMTLPAAFIRLGMDTKAWQTLKDCVARMLSLQPDLTWLETLGPYDNPTKLCRSHGRQNVLVTLIKLRMLFDLVAAPVAAWAMRQKGLPQELVALIVKEVTCTDIIAGDHNLAYKDRELTIQSLREQISWLVSRVENECKDFWPFILANKTWPDRKHWCGTDPSGVDEYCVWDRSFNRGAIRQAWLETPGAMNYLVSLRKTVAPELTTTNQGLASG